MAKPLYPKGTAPEMGKPPKYINKDTKSDFPVLKIHPNTLDHLNISGQIAYDAKTRVSSGDPGVIIKRSVVRDTDSRLFNQDSVQSRETAITGRPAKESQTYDKDRLYSDLSRQKREIGESKDIPPSIRTSIVKRLNAKMNRVYRIMSGQPDLRKNVITATKQINLLETANNPNVPRAKQDAAVARSKDLTERYHGIGQPIRNDYKAPNPPRMGGAGGPPRRRKM